MTHTNNMTRRTAITLAVVGPISLCVAPSAFAKASAPLVACLTNALAQGELPFTPALLTLMRFEESKQNLTAVVRLSWGPGTRTQRFTCTSDCSDVALEDLTQDILSYFRKVA